jgi:uncharacterized phage protein (TIGR01671 family)
MRETKYRIWDDKFRQMCQVSRIQFEDPKKVEGYGLTSPFGYRDIDISIFPLLQYTGLKDKNGKEIYEGDIIRMPANKRRPEYIGKVYFIDCGFEIHLSGSDWMPMEETNEVIGNIYQNPNLITPSK